MTRLTLDQALQKGIEAHKAGKVQEADQYYTAILKAQPKHPDANHKMGALAVAVGKVQAALPFFKTALEANPATAHYWVSYIETLITLQRLAEAKAVLDRAKAMGAEGKGFDKLEQRLKEAGEAQDPPSEQLQVLVKLHSRGQLQNALKQAETLIQQFPKSPVLFNIKGAVLKGLGELDLSVEAYNKALSIKPDYAEAYNNMGNVLREQGKLEEAIEDFNKALEIKPDYAECHNNIGITLKDQGKLSEALAAFNKALSIRPDYAEAYNDKGIVLKYQGKLDEAIEVYKKVVALKPDFAKAYNNMGAILQDQGKMDAAIAAFNKALSIRPDYADVAWNRHKQSKI